MAALSLNEKKGTIIMEELYEILEEMQPEIDFHKETALIDDHLLDSLTVLSLISELEDAFDITIPAVEIIPQNFNSAEAMWELIQRLADE
jgi:acyl carrier protein